MSSLVVLIHFQTRCCFLCCWILSLFVHILFFHMTVLPPCRSVCEKMVVECRDTFTELNMQARLPDCSQVINSTLGGPIPAFPDDSTGMCYLPAVQISNWPFLPAFISSLSNFSLSLCFLHYIMVHVTLTMCRPSVHGSRLPMAFPL